MKKEKRDREKIGRRSDFILGEMAIERASSREIGLMVYLAVAVLLMYGSANLRSICACRMMWTSGAYTKQNSERPIMSVGKWPRYGMQLKRRLRLFAGPSFSGSLTSDRCASGRRSLHAS